MCYNKGTKGKGKRKMMKCPCCGSSAQVALVWQDFECYSEDFYREYHCGCGCDFEVVYHVTDVKVLNEKATNSCKCDKCAELDGCWIGQHGGKENCKNYSPKA